MHKNISLFSHIAIFTCLLLLLSGSAVSAASVKERMAARIPAINSLKDEGNVGENNKGLLEFRGPKKQEQIVNGENKDRNMVYQVIAKKQGASPELVGKRRAKMIAQKGKKGHWFQRPDGSWYKK